MMSQKTVLLIDDDVTLLDLLSDHVRKADYLCVTANSGRQGLIAFANEEPDIIVLDVMMPGMDGWEVCSTIRQKSDVPVIMLTAKDQEIDKLRGFQLGVDDYVTKPFSFAEIVARITAVVSRTYRDAASDQFTSGNLLIDSVQFRVFREGIEIELTPTEFRLLEMLARHANQTIPSGRLLDEVWGPEYAGQIDQVKHYIWSLRRKIEEDPGDPRHIITERGFGYRFE